MRADKQLLLDEIKEQIGNSKAMIVTRYNRLQPIISWQLQTALKKSGCHYEVVKKSVFSLAAKEHGMTYDLSELTGHIGVVFVKEDALAASKTLYQFMDDNANLMEVIAGEFEGNKMSASEFMALAKLPSQNEMRAQFIGLLEAPMSQTLSVMENLLSSIMFCLENKAKESN